MQDRSRAARWWAQIEDRLIPALRLSTHERAIYYHLFRRTHLRGEREIRVSRHTLGQATGLNVSTARHYLGVLAAKQCVRFLDRGVRGCLLRVRLPDEIFAELRRRGGELLAAPVERDAKGHFRPWPRRHDHRREALRGQIFRRDRGRCFYCRRRLPGEWTLDHLVPTIRGGRVADPANLAACCAVCNAEKGTSTAADFLRALRARGVLSRAQLRSRQKRLRALRSVGRHS